MKNIWNFFKRNYIPFSIVALVLIGTSPIWILLALLLFYGVIYPLWWLWLILLVVGFYSLVKKQ
jgi:hypothetical protein